MADDWFVFHKGINEGPFSFDHLKDLVNKGDIVNSDEVFDPIQNTWFQAHQVEGLFPKLSSPIEASPNNLKSKLNLNKNGSNSTNVNSTQKLVFSNLNLPFRIGKYLNKIFIRCRDNLLLIPDIDKIFLKQAFILFGVISVLLFSIGSSANALVWFLKLLLLILVGPSLIFLMFSGRPLPQEKKIRYYKISVGPGLFLGLIYAGKLGGFFSIIFFSLFSFIGIIGVVFFLNRIRNAFIVCFSISAIGLLFLYPLCGNLHQGEDFSRDFGVSSNKAHLIFGKWEVPNKQTVVEFTSGGSLIFGNLTRRYRFGRSNVIEILYNSGDLVDETLTIDFQSKDELIVVNSNSYGDFAHINGRLIRVGLPDLKKK